MPPCDAGGGHARRTLEDLQSRPVRAKHTGYSVPGWGVGDLWTSDVAVLAHEFRFGGGVGSREDGAESDPTTSGARPLALSADVLRAGILRAHAHEGAGSPPTGTVPSLPSRVGYHSVPTLHRATRAGDVDPGELAGRVAAFLGGADVEFGDVPLDLAGLTDFQLSVARSLRAIPRGEIVSYAELAALAGYPAGQRAVGTFCARNRFAFLLPCHRVVGSNGIGGYGSAGVAVKRRLLALEGVSL